MSCAASAFPQNRTWMNPSSMSQASASRPPAWMIAGPPASRTLQSGFPVRCPSRRTCMRLATSATMWPCGRSAETCDSMKLNTSRSWGRRKGITRIPVRPVTTSSPRFTSPIGTARAALFPAFTTIPRSISIRSTSSHRPCSLTCVGRCVVA